MEFCTDIFSSSYPIKLNLSSILKEISPEYSLEGLRLKLKLQYFGHLMQRADALEKTLMLGLKAGEGDDRGRVCWTTSPTQWTWVWVSSVTWWWTGKPGVLQSMGSQTVGHNWVTALSRYTYQKGSRTSLILASRRVQCVYFSHFFV